MRSRPDLTLFLHPRTPAAGQRLIARVRLEVHSETPCDGIQVVLVGREQRYRSTATTGKTSVRLYHRREVLRLGGRMLPGTLHPGVQEHELAFDLPVDAPPSFRSVHTTIEYELEVRVEIPWWPDAHEVYDLTVLGASRDGVHGRPRVATNVTGEQRGKDLALELSLADDVLRPGGTIRGALSLTGLGEKKLRRVEVSLVAIESPRVTSSAGPEEVERRTWVVREGTPDEGEAIPLALAVPAEAAPSFESPFIELRHALDATAVVAWGSDVAVRVPVMLVRGAAEARPEAVPVVGRARNLAVWHEAVRAVQVPGAELVRFEPEAARVVFAVKGLRVHAREEVRDEGPCLVAEIGWEDLGLGMRLSERRWTDFGAFLSIMDDAFQRRFTVRGREGAQVAALLDPELRTALARFDEAAMDDQRAVVVLRGGVFQLAGLRRFLVAVQHLASLLARAAQRVQPPAGLALALPAYRQFAQRVNATVRVGDLSLHRWTLRGVTLRLVHRWQDEQALGSALETTLPEGAEAARWEVALGEAFATGASVRAGVASLALDRVHDPAEIGEVAERFVDAALRAQRREGLAPYRG